MLAAPGSPAERRLAIALGVGRGTVVAAYDELVADGVVERRRGSGTFVLGPDTLGLPPGREGSTLVHRLVDRSAVGGPPRPVADEQPPRPAAVVDLSLSVVGDAAGLPDVGLSTADLLGIAPDTGYTPWGLPELRVVLARHVAAWGVPTRPEQIVVTTGAQQALSAAAACWVRPGDLVAVDDPTYPGAIATFTQAGARLVPMTVDGGGVRPDAVERALAQRPALVYLQSGPHSPTGAVLPAARRRAIAAMVVAARTPLVEDAALTDLAWEASSPPIAADCGDAAVALVGSLGKLYWGGLRVGFVRAPEPVALRFARVKATHDLGSSAAGQLLAERLLAAAVPGTSGRSGRAGAPGAFGPGASSFAAWRRGQLRERYEVLADGLRRHLPAWEWEPPGGGMSLWVRLPGTDAVTFAQHALRDGVAVATQAPLSCSGAHRDRIRLSFSPGPEGLVEAVARLAHTWHSTR